ncbi:MULTISPECIES: hypothetical protein [unclassified Pseudomonas]|uniref:hypothetical protein n=1 Tax=unclassified Pseudomonas TaxID=196821 RepID=UPI002448FCA2|nr:MULTISPECIES: hypothetical protein [unclassified Pseudomonas]MDG9930056.1 hypothetical protein [Pseudomonas sp. GD04042]MDH0483542.1 hypothetical protein [Pseudomonas sp. GD04015]MDH0605538.1 hypothetical protein [Pseudomonas sp. GD03869]
MNLNRTRQLLREDIDRDNPLESLVHLLESVLELLSLPDNDFLWSFWKDEDEAKRDIVELIGTLRNGALPEKVKVSGLFVPTGPLQEVSLGSGWGDAFIAVAAKYDEVEALLWRQGSQ